MKKEIKRCWELDEGDMLMAEYHDKEWGVPMHDDPRLFEVLVLDGAQAGLSWRTILNKRENYRKAFDNFNVKKVARYTAKKQKRLMQNKGIVRNRLKVASAVQNAKIFLEIQKEFCSFDTYIWKFVGGKPIINRWENLSDMPARTELSDKISKDLKKRGMTFVGSTIIYAIMQTIGMVNDHKVGCFRHNKLRI